MKHVVGKMPWDMVVFLTITTVGFGVSLKRLAYPETWSAESPQAQVERAPASISVGKNALLDLGCLESLLRKDNRSLDERTVRVKGKLCYSEHGKRKYFENIAVKNLTTGDESTVFFQDGDKSFLTDAMLLSPGKNVIQVRWKESLKDSEKIVVTELFGR